MTKGEDPDPDVTAELERAGLYDPRDAGADARMELLRFNLAQGVTVEEMTQAARAGRLAYVGGDPHIRPRGPRLTIGEVADRAGASVEQVARMWRCAGFAEPDPDEPVMSHADVGLVEVFRTVAGVLGEDVTMQVLRTMGAALARVAEAEVTAFTTIVGADRVGSGDLLGLARLNVGIAQMLPRIATVLDVLHRRQLQTTVNQLMGNPADRESETKRLAVGFADLVGFTGWTARSDPRALAALVEEFEAWARGVVADRGGRVVKMIGDEVMFVAGDAAAACAVAAGLVEEVGRQTALSQLRAGLAFGDVLTLHGDYYGPVVNLAARLASAATPGGVLVAAEIPREIDNDRRWRFRPAGPQRLKGFAEPVEVYELTGQDR